VANIQTEVSSVVRDPTKMLDDARIERFQCGKNVSADDVAKKSGVVVGRVVRVRETVAGDVGVDISAAGPV
jgi:uncharacterized protein YggE